VQFKELLRYHFYRRSRTWASAFFADVRDIYFNEPYPELHRIYSARQADLDAADEITDAGTQVPQFGGNVDQQFFAFDMDDLYAISEVEEYAGVSKKPTDYLFFMTPDTGAGCAIAVDKASRKFIECVDGKRSVKEIAELMGSDLSADAERIYATFAAAGLFDRPRFLTEFEEGTVAWQSCFPEVYRAYH
jgi:hypothetical protein